MDRGWRPLIIYYITPCKFRNEGDRGPTALGQATRIMPVISNSEMILRKMAEEEEAKEEAARQWEASAAERAHKAKMAEQHAAKQARRRWARRCH